MRYIYGHLCSDWAKNIYLIMLNMIFPYQNDSHYYDADVVAIRVWISSSEYKDDHHKDI